MHASRRRRHSIGWWPNSNASYVVVAIQPGKGKPLPSNDIYEDTDALQYRLRAAEGDDSTEIIVQMRRQRLEFNMHHRRHHHLRHITATVRLAPPVLLAPQERLALPSRRVHKAHKAKRVIKVKKDRKGTMACPALQTPHPHPHPAQHKKTTTTTRVMIIIIIIIHHPIGHIIPPVEDIKDNPPYGHPHGPSHGGGHHKHPQGPSHGGHNGDDHHHHNHGDGEHNHNHPQSPSHPHPMPDPNNPQHGEPDNDGDHHHHQSNPDAPDHRDNESEEMPEELPQVLYEIAPNNVEMERDEEVIV
ncbi:developmental regulatory protein wetA-like [Drosophila subobscura]|uniref:developmental regulatory protein wetA-like n=1 Tax=Drosophila subobscura TaxID=7241 RepID=UPI00155A745D|nr:developmental regulatory protein wetA-like [Drosophila subobscura]